MDLEIALRANVLVAMETGLMPLAVAMLSFIRRQTAQGRTFPSALIGVGAAFLLVLERQIIIMGGHNAPFKARTNITSSATGLQHVRF